MSDKQRRPILYKGESYSSPIKKVLGGKTKEPIISYEQARLNILNNIETSSETLKGLSSEYRLPNEIILCVRIDPEFTAKSFYPETLFDQGINDIGLREIGSRSWRKSSSTSSGEAPDRIGRMFFVRTTENGLNKFKEKLNRSEASLYKNFKTEIRRLSEINLLSPSEQVLGFDSTWTEGKIEAVIHPFELDGELAFEKFQDLAHKAGANSKSLRYKQYEEGVTFISMYGNRQLVDALTGYNPLRTIHPLVMREFPTISRSTYAVGLPQPPTFKKKSSMVLGVIDGGANKKNPHINNYVEFVDCVSEPEADYGVEHGTQVTSAALYGPLNDYKNTDQLPEPPISVKSFRVISEASGGDPELYDIIDCIEEIIPDPANKEIAVYNLSLGPGGPILDDYISRFTFACDLLSKKHEVLFCVAVGNDGHLAAPYNRIQSPSDMVNGLAVGAYTITGGKKHKAAYSSIGLGREGNKLKPDLVAFGGCELVPIHLISSQPNNRAYTMGTSFASPPVASAATQLVGGSKKAINALVARALLIHSTPKENENSHCVEMGHGFLPENLEDVVICVDKSYTLIYQGEVPAKTFVQYDIPWINDPQLKGKVNFRWTVAVLSNVDPQSPDDYTTSSVVVSFCPSSNKYNFKKGGKTKIVDVKLKPDEVKRLLEDGWKQSEFPTSVPIETPFAKEQELRANLKWDSIDYRERTVLSSGIEHPVFHVHAMNRGKRNADSKVKFAIILTVEAPKVKEDLYAKVIANYPALLPLKVDIQATVPINVSRN